MRPLSSVAALMLLVAGCSDDKDATAEAERVDESGEVQDDADDDDRDAAEVAEIRVEGPDRVEVGESFRLLLTALDANGEPVGGARLTASSEPPLFNLPDHDNWMTDDEGRLSASQLEATEAGTHTVTLSLGDHTDTIEIEAEER